MAVKIIFFWGFLYSSLAQQKFEEPPTYKEVNSGDEVILPCVVMNKAGECRWEKDGTPVGMYVNKYEWAVVNNVGDGDCSIKIVNAHIDYDNGVWQCQVTASDFTQKDTLISDGAELVVRGKYMVFSSNSLN